MVGIVDSERHVRRMSIVVEIHGNSPVAPRRLRMAREFQQRNRGWHSRIIHRLRSIDDINKGDRVKQLVLQIYNINPTKFSIPIYN